MNQKRRTVLVTILALIALIMVAMVALMTGRFRISPNAFLGALSGVGEYEIERSIILNLRLPRTIAAILVGVSLSLSGLLYQEMFQNKLVSPDLLGVSSGAGVGAAIAIVAGFSSALVGVFAFVFGIGTVLLTVSVSRIFQDRSSMTLVLAGIIVGGLAGAIQSLLKYLADAETTLASITFWLMGSFERVTINDIWPLLFVAAFGIIISMVIRWRVSIVALGYDQAQSKGVNYRLFRALIIIVATLMTACAVSVSGTIGWIGLVVPHIVRTIVGNETTKTIPLSILFGSVFMVLTDIIARSFTAAEIPLSAVTGFFGTIIFVIVLISKRRAMQVHD